MSELTLVEFLTQRLDEDEAAARAAVIPAWSGDYKPHPEYAEWFYREGGEVEYVQTAEALAHKYPDRLYVTCDSEGLSPSVVEAVGPHIARHDPARVLVEVQAKRAIVALFELEANRRAAYRSPRSIEIEDEQATLARRMQEARTRPLENVLRVLASVFSDHPDYRQEWEV